MVSHTVPRTVRIGIASLVGLALAASTSAAQSIADRYRGTADRTIAEATRDSAAWNRVALLTETFGNRLSGSQSLERAIDWIIARMKEDGLQNVRGEDVMVPRWIRGEESADLVSPRRQSLPKRPTRRRVTWPREFPSVIVLPTSSCCPWRWRGAVPTARSP